MRSTSAMLALLLFLLSSATAAQDLLTTSTEHYSLVLREVAGSKDENGFSDFDLSLRSKGNQKEMWKDRISGGGFAALTVNGQEKEAIEVQASGNRWLIFGIGWWQGWRTWVGTILLREGKNGWVFHENKDLLAYYGVLVIKNDLLAFCDGWSAPDENDHQYVLGTVISLKTNAVLCSALPLLTDDHKPMPRFDDDVGNVEKAYDAYQGQLRVALETLVSECKRK